MEGNKTKPLAQLSVACSLVILAFSYCCPPPESFAISSRKPRCQSANFADDTGFVRSCNGIFILDGKPFPVVGVNAYYLQEEASRELDRGHQTSPTIQEVMKELVSLNVTVIRTWAFHDGAKKTFGLQVGAENYSEKGFRGLDHVIAQAERHGLKLILTLVNYWPEYGGVDQYLQWHNLPKGRQEDRGAFFIDPELRAHFKRHIQHVVSRRNQETGRYYKEEPSILGWELMNEGRGLGASKWLHTMWVQEMTDALRATGVKQLLSTGGSGYDDIEYSDQNVEDVVESIGKWTLDGSMEVSYSLNQQLVDFGTVHCYPEAWNVSKKDGERSCRAWIRLHGRISRENNRPTICTEIALVNQEQFSEGNYGLAERRSIYRSWMKLAENGELAGLLPWLYIPDKRPESWDKHSFGLRNESLPEDKVNKYTDLIKDHGEAMKKSVR